MYNIPDSQKLMQKGTERLAIFFIISSLVSNFISTKFAILISSSFKEKPLHTKNV